MRITGRPVRRNKLSDQAVVRAFAFGSTPWLNIWDTAAWPLGDTFTTGTIPRAREVCISSVLIESTAGASLDVSDKLIARLFVGGKTTRVCSICVNIVISLSRAAVKTPIWTVTTTATCLPKNLSIGVMPRWTVFHQILPGNVARRRLYKNAFRVFSVITVVLYIIIHWGSRSKSSARMSVEKWLRN